MFAMTHFLKLCYNVFILKNKIDASLLLQASWLNPYPQIGRKIGLIMVFFPMLQISLRMCQLLKQP
jgi:hypothetical protein